MKPCAGAGRKGGVEQEKWCGGVCLNRAASRQAGEGVQVVES